MCWKQNWKDFLFYFASNKVQQKYSHHPLCVFFIPQYSQWCNMYGRYFNFILHSTCYFSAVVLYNIPLIIFTYSFSCFIFIFYEWKLLAALSFTGMPPTVTYGMRWNIHIKWMCIKKGGRGSKKKYFFMQMISFIILNDSDLSEEQCKWKKNIVSKV